MPNFMRKVKNYLKLLRKEKFIREIDPKGMLNISLTIGLIYAFISLISSFYLYGQYF